MAATGHAPIAGHDREPHGAASHDEHVQHTVEQITRLEGRDKLEMRWSDHVANAVTAFSGSMLFVWLHIVWFAAWVGLNLPGGLEFDEFPFGFLTMIVSLEAIFLSTFVLISQNRQSIRADRRAKVDLEVNVIAEQEVTKLIKMVAKMHESMGLHDEGDDEVQAMKRRMDVKDLADAADEVEQQARRGSSDKASDPDSAADTE